MFYGVTEAVRKDYKNLTQTDIYLSVNHKNLVCELCVKYLQLSNLLKNQLIKNQRKFLIGEQHKIRDGTENTKNPLIKNLNINYACGICSLKFETKQYLKDHIIDKHESEKNAAEA